MVRNWAELLVVSFFVLWLLLCLLVYVPRFHDIIRNLDEFALIPEWRFFAPNPGRHDFHLLFRDKFRDGAVGPWTEIAPIDGRRLWNVVLNAGKRKNKALLDCMRDFAKQVNGKGGPIELSIPYLTLLNYVSCIPRNPPSQEVQFLLMYSAGEDIEKDPEILYLSRFHRM